MDTISKDMLYLLDRDLIIKMVNCYADLASDYIKDYEGYKERLEDLAEVIKLLQEVKSDMSE